MQDRNPEARRTVPSRLPLCNAAVLTEPIRVGRYRFKWVTSECAVTRTQFTGRKVVFPDRVREGLFSPFIVAPVDGLGGERNAVLDDLLSEAAHPLLVRV